MFPFLLAAEKKKILTIEQKVLYIKTAILFKHIKPSLVKNTIQQQLK